MSESFKLRDATFGGEGVQPELKDGSWEQLRELIYGDRGAPSKARPK